ncbi:MAG: hypothetical protein MJ003_04315 [Paludibacteraceae bacterium]|nr:hypothetical protein [Paludibacteraceae bacterium]
MAKYTKQDRKTLIGWFPNLKNDSNFKITSDCTPAYNCIGWALGMNDVWVGLDHPTNFSWSWWPSSVPCNSKKESLVKLFEYFGFSKCRNSCIEENYDKVALFANSAGWTHAARVVSNTELHSKIGTAWDIYHSKDNIFTESDYGSIYMYMFRPIADRYITDLKRPSLGKVFTKSFSAAQRL